MPWIDKPFSVVADSNGNISVQQQISSPTSGKLKEYRITTTTGCNNRTHNLHLVVTNANDPTNSLPIDITISDCTNVDNQIQPAFTVKASTYNITLNVDGFDPGEPVKGSAGVLYSLFQLRSINDVANSLRTTRLFLEPVSLGLLQAIPHPGPVGSNDGLEALGVPAYNGTDTDSGPSWYRILGKEGALDRESTMFIYASLPDLVPSQVFGLENAGYLDIDENVKISFVQFNWGDDVITELSRFKSPHSTLEIDNHTLTDLWLVWSGDANSQEFVQNGHASKHGGGSIFSANFLITVYRNNNGSIGSKIGDAAINVHGADAGELVVQGNYLMLITATTAIQVGLWILGE
jgi:hypothetical protein